MIEFILKMKFGFCNIIDGIIYVLSLTTITTNYGLDAARKIAIYRQKK